MTEFTIFALPGDLIVNRIPEQDADLQLGYRLALGEVVRSGIKGIDEGARIVFAPQDAKEFELPGGIEWGFKPSGLGLWHVREGALRFQIVKRPHADSTEARHG
jgi:hypothetical protein